MGKTVAYLRVSTDQQDLENQRFEITRYAESRNLQIHDWIQVEVSSRKNLQDRRIAELTQSLRKEVTDLLYLSFHGWQGRCGRPTILSTT